jgi:gluconokinase
LSEGGSLFAWMKNTFQLADSAEFEAQLNSLSPDGHGLTVLPFLTGERSPGWQGHARATIHGISQATTPLEILQAGMEAVACRIALVFEKLAQLLPDDLRIVAGGGALHNSPAWLQIITDILGRASEVPAIREVSARGAALLAFESLGVVTDLKDIPVSIERICYPDESDMQFTAKQLNVNKDSMKN